MPPVHYPSHTLYTSPTVAAAMDTKYAKQTANATRRYGANGFRGPREISADSGIANMSFANNYYGTSSAEHSLSLESPLSNSATATGAAAAAGSAGALSASRRNKNRPRNLEMVLSARHKFDVRELDDSLSDDSPLTLPKLPSSFGMGACGQQPAPLSGLTRQQLPQYSTAGATAGQPGTATAAYRKASFASLLDVDSIEEEKEFRDKSTSEKSTRSGANLMVAGSGSGGAGGKEWSPSSKNSSPISSRASWCNAGETMAAKDCSSMSVSSSDSLMNQQLRDGGNGGNGGSGGRALSLDEADDVDNCSSAVLISADMLCE